MRLKIFLVAVLFSAAAFAARNSTGTFSLYTPGNPVNTGTTISSSWANNTLSDIGSEITNSLDRSGRGGMLAALRGIDGTVASPAFSWTNEPGTGFYRIGAGDIALSILGVKVVEWTSTVTTMPAIAVTQTGAQTRGAIRLTGQSTASAPTNGDLWYDITLSPNRFAGQLHSTTTGAPAAISYNANWSDSGAQTVKYWLGIDNMVHVQGQAQSAGGAASSPFTLPAGYRPSKQIWVPCQDESSPATACSLTVSTAGVVTITNGFTAGHLYTMDVINFLSEN